MPKKITVISLGVIAVGPQYETLWDDVWLTTTIKPGRTKLRLAPCLISRAKVEEDYETDQALQKRHPDGDWDEDVKKWEKILSILKTKDLYIEDPANTLTNIYTSSELINRDAAEKMIAALLKNYGFESIMCKWKRPPIVFGSV
jgi:hypothetical protein